MGIFEDELRKAQQWRAQMDAQEQAQRAQDEYNARLAAAKSQAQQAQNAAPGGLAGVLAGIGNSIKNVGNTLYNMGGTGIASLRDVVTGNAGTGKYQKEWKEYAKENIYGDKDLTDKDYYAKTGGKALDAAATVSDFIPGLGAGARVALNVGQGAASGVAQNYIDNGANVSLEDNLKGALVGSASAGVGQAVGNKLAKGIGGNGVISKTLNSNIGRGALTGAASGATGAGLSTALNGGGLGEVLGSAAQGAGGGALGGATMAGVMGLAGTGAEKLKNKVLGVEPDTTTAKAAKVQNIAQEADAEQPKKGNMAGRALKNMGEQLETAQTNLTSAERNKLGIKNTGEVVDNVRKRTGISSVQDQADFTKNITGAGEASVMDTIQKRNMSVDEKGKPLTLSEAKYNVAVNEAVGGNWRKSTMGESYDQFKEDLLSDIKATDPISASNRLKADARKFRAAETRTGDPKAGVKAKIYTEVANKLDDLSYSAVPEKNVNRMFDDTIDEFRTRAKEAQAQGDKKYAKAYENLAKELEETPRTIKAFRSFKKDFVDASKVAEISAGARSGSLEAGLSRGINLKNKIVNTLLAEPTDRAMAWAGGKISDLGDVVNGQGVGKIGQKVGAVVNKAANAVGGATSALNNDFISSRAFGGSDLGLPTVGDVATSQIARQAGKAEASQVEAQRDMQNAQQEMQNAETDYKKAMTQAQQLYAQAQAPQVSAGQQQLERISNAMTMALNAGDINAYSQLASLYNQAYKMYGSDAEANDATKLNATQQGNLAKIQSAGSAIDKLEQLYSQAGGGQGRIGGGIAETLAGMGMNSNVSSYNAMARGLINQIVAAVGKTDALNNEGEVQRALDLVPKITDTAEEAQIKLQSLRDMLNANQQTYNELYGIAE